MISKVSLARTTYLGERTGQVQYNGETVAVVYERMKRTQPILFAEWAQLYKEFFVANLEPAFALLFGKGLVRVGTQGFSARAWKLSSRLYSSSVLTLALPAKFRGCEFSLGRYFGKTKFRFSWCRISPRWQRNFVWLIENARVESFSASFCRIFARTKNEIRRDSLSILLHSTVRVLIFRTRVTTLGQVKRYAGCDKTTIEGMYV